MSILWRRDGHRCHRHRNLAFTLSADIEGELTLHAHVPKAVIAAMLYDMALQLAAQLGDDTPPAAP